MAATKRIQIPFNFSYPVPVFVAVSSAGAVTTAATVMEPVVGATVTVTNRDTGNPVTVFQQETGSSTYSSLTTDASGNVPGWVVGGSYRIVCAAHGAFTGATVNFDPVRGDGVELIADGAVGPSALQSAGTYAVGILTATLGNLISSASGGGQVQVRDLGAPVNTGRARLLSASGSTFLQALTDAGTPTTALSFPNTATPNVTVAHGLLAHGSTVLNGDISTFVRNLGGDANMAFAMGVSPRLLTNSSGQFSYVATTGLSVVEAAVANLNSPAGSLVDPAPFQSGDITTQFNYPSDGQVTISVINAAHSSTLQLNWIAFGQS